MPWKTTHKNHKGSKSGKEHSVVLLLGGSIYDDCTNVRIMKRRRRGDEHSRTKQDVRLEEFFCQRDFRALSDFFERTGATIWRCIPTTLYCSRREAFEHINQFFRLDVGEKTTFIIYWCGHGEPETGNWCFSNGGEITCRDLIHAWRSRPSFGDMSALTIIADTCYSGAWIPELQAENVPHLAYQAASRADEAAYVVDDGNVPRSLLMRKFFVEQQKSIERYTWTCAQQHPVHYCDYAETEDAQEQNDGQRRALVRGGSLSFFTIDHHWILNDKISQKEQETILNTLAQSGTFIGKL